MCIVLVKRIYFLFLVISFVLLLLLAFLFCLLFTCVHYIYSLTKTEEKGGEGARGGGGGGGGGHVGVCMHNHTLCYEIIFFAAHH